mmetsp:Transcript_36240/g.85756  ORF Transcript_36240/g.85756 Transcript_36240/m.85756 type:complete len:340 (+) Transcript_36240:423-1442(+)
MLCRDVPERHPHQSVHGARHSLDHLSDVHGGHVNAVDLHQKISQLHLVVDDVAVLVHQLRQAHHLVGSLVLDLDADHPALRHLGIRVGRGGRLNRAFGRRGAFGRGQRSALVVRPCARCLLCLRSRHPHLRAKLALEVCDLFFERYRLRLKAANLGLVLVLVLALRHLPLLLQAHHLLLKRADSLLVLIARSLLHLLQLLLQLHDARFRARERGLELAVLILHRRQLGEEVLVLFAIQRDVGELRRFDGEQCGALLVRDLLLQLASDGLEVLDALLLALRRLLPRLQQPLELLGRRVTRAQQLQKAGYLRILAIPALGLARSVGGPCRALLGTRARRGG